MTAVVAAFGQGAFSFKINEVVVSNTDGLIDEYGERTGWIEIANTSWGTNNLRSCYLTTNREALNKGLSVPERVKLMSLIPKGDERTNLTPSNVSCSLPTDKPTWHIAHELHLEGRRGKLHRLV